MHTSPTTEHTNPPHQRSGPAPLLGTAFAALFVLAFVGSGGGAESDTPGSEVIADHAQSSSTLLIFGTALIIAAIVLVFFGGWLRQTLRSTATGPDWLPDVVLAGAIIHAVTLTTFVSSSNSVQHAIDTGDPAIAQALNIASGSDFVTAMLGLACMLIATGVSAYRSGALPRWLAVVSIILGVMAPLGPGGFAPFLTFPVWVVVVSFMATSRPRATDDVTVRSTSSIV